MEINEERLVKIETKSAFQEKTIQDLNDMLYEQQQEIERLVSTCSDLVERVKRLSELIPEINASENETIEKPPHY